MKINKILNNNLVSTWDEKGQEIIVKGKGIGFQKRKGDSIEKAQVEKIFSLKNPAEFSLYKQLLARIPDEHVQVAEYIISYAKKSLNKELDEHIYITLSDHISYAIERQKQGMQFNNPLLWEIRRFYPHEYQIGLEGLNIINEELNIDLPETEASFIALHIIDAELNIDMQQTMQMTEMIQDILNIIKYYFNVTFDEGGLDYNRLITHLKYFVLRVMNGTQEPENDMDFINFIRNKYPKAYDCSNQISKYMMKKINHILTEEEKLYLTVHIQRVIFKGS